VFAASVRAEEGPSADEWIAPAIEKIEACRQASTVDHSPSEDCIGLIVSICPGKDASTSSMVGCFEVERRYWASQIAAPLQALRAFKAKFLGNQEPDYAVAPLLDIYQKDWETWLQDKCGFAAHRYRRGSIGRITRGMRGMRPTGERVLELEMMVRQDVRE
jgi:hypothetical protein